MKILGLDTSTRAVCVGIVDGGLLIAEFTLNTKEKHSSHSRLLMPIIDEILGRAKIAIRDIDLIAVTRGPGSWTGLRIGVTTAKCLAYALKKPLIGLPTLDILAHNIPFAKGLICPLIDARKGEVYTALYRSRGEDIERLSDYEVLKPAELISHLVTSPYPSDNPLLRGDLSLKGERMSSPEPTIFLGDGAIRYREVIAAELKGKALFADVTKSYPRGTVVAGLGGKRFEQGESHDYFSLIPLYIRRPEAEIKWEERRKIKKEES